MIERLAIVIAIIAGVWLVHYFLYRCLKNFMFAGIPYPSLLDRILIWMLSVVILIFIILITILFGKALLTLGYWIIYG